MGFDALIAKVQQAEQALETRERRGMAQWRQLQATWRAGWTPARIMVAGLATGFLVGRSRPLRLAGSGGLLNLVGALSGLFAGAGAQQAAEEAEAAAASAEAAGTNGTADTATPTATPTAELP